MNTNTKGRLAELLAITKFIELDYTVLEPVNKDGIYDFVIEKDNNFQKVQVKCLRDKGDIYSMIFYSTSHNRKENKRKFYTKEEIDLFVGVDITAKIVVSIPIEKANKAEMNLRKEVVLSTNYKMNFLKDYLI